MFSQLGSSAAFGTTVRVGPGSVDGYANSPLVAAGVSIGHASVADTGVTVIACPEGAIAAVDVRGGGPGTRETDVLAPENTVERVNAIVLSGGSAFGLATADGVMRELAERGIGFQVTPAFPDIRVPIVPAAVIFDLLLGSHDVPDAALGRRAVSIALDSLHDAHHTPATESGCVGAGTGAMAGALKGGFGQACVRAASISGLAEGTWVAALMAANPMGAVVDSDGRLFGNPMLPVMSAESLAALDTVFVGRTKVMREQPENSRHNTTIGCVVTNAPLTQAQAKRLAMCAHDGLARAIRPAHAPMDGDTIFALSVPEKTGESTRADSEQDEARNVTSDDAPLGVSAAQLGVLTAMAADVVQFAIVDAVTSATPRAGVSAYCEGTT